MPKLALAILAICSVALRGQAPPEVSGDAEADRAAAYYHYTVALMYAELAAAGDHNAVYSNKAIENYKAAIKADPQMPLRNEDIAKIYARAASQRPVVPRLVAPQSPKPSTSGKPQVHP